MNRRVQSTSRSTSYRIKSGLRTTPAMNRVIAQPRRPASNAKKAAISPVKAQMKVARVGVAVYELMTVSIDQRRGDGVNQGLERYSPPMPFLLIARWGRGKPRGRFCCRLIAWKDCGIYRHASPDDHHEKTNNEHVLADHAQITGKAGEEKHGSDCKGNVHGRLQWQMR